MSSCWRKTDRKYNRVVYADDAVDLSGSLDDVSTQLIQPSQPSRVTVPNDPDEMFRRATDERKYKYSLLSVLIIGVFLIMMVNLGLGYRNCGRDDEEKHVHFVPHPVKKDYCMDTTTGLLFPWQDYRLPGSVSPQQYDIFIHPNLTERTYSGRVKVVVAVMEATTTIIMHSDKNNITSVTLLLLDDDKTSSSPPLKPVKQFKCDTNNMIALQFEQPLLVGSSYELRIEFESTLHYGLDGLYLSKYTDEADKQHVIATTQFESVAARAAFPCFDEPAFKANFSLSVVRDDKQLVLFNTPLKESKTFEDGVSKVDIFEPTVKMSSYLVAFVISEFICTTCHTTSGVKVSVYSQPDKVDDTMYATNFSCQVLDYYEKLFRIPYPLPKLDLVAIPDFAAGAMENWGLVTYRQTALLYNPKTSSLQDKQWVAKVIAHELAHQWFGNLVTMEWWDDLWLNEGFASYMEYKGMDSVEKEWNVMSDFLLDHTSNAMDADSFLNTHKISLKTTNSLEIAQLFDTITYDKGACIIYMLIDWLGKDDFFSGITAYLNKYAYSNAENGDLINYLAEASPAAKKGKVAKMMETWTSQAGLPIVHVSKSTNQSKILLKQTRFTFPTGKSGEDTGELWDIPVSYVTSNNPSMSHRYFISGKTTEVDVGSTFDWIKLNHNQAGYYRVNYDHELWDGLLSQMTTDHRIFSSSDRVGLISDAFISAYVGLMKYDRLLEMSKYLVNEANYAPLSTAVSELATIDKLLRFHKSGSGASDMMRSYIKSLLSSQFDRLAWKTTNQLSLEDVKLQQAVVQTVCLMGHKPCVKEATRLLEDWLVNATAIPSNWISLVFNTALKHGSKSTWDRAWLAYLKETDPNVKSKLLSGLSLTTDGDKVMFLHHKLDDNDGDDIKSQDHAKVLVYTSSSLSGSTLAWNFVKNSWSKLVEIHGSTSFAMRYIVSSCLKSLIQEKEISAADKFFQEQKISQLSFIKKSLESARVRINWAVNNAATVDNWLHDNPIHTEL